MDSDDEPLKLRIKRYELLHDQYFRAENIYGRVYSGILIGQGFFGAAIGWIFSSKEGFPKNLFLVVIAFLGTMLSLGWWRITHRDKLHQNARTELLRLYEQDLSKFSNFDFKIWTRIEDWTSPKGRFHGWKVRWLIPGLFFFGWFALFIFSALAIIPSYALQPALSSVPMSYTSSALPFGWFKDNWLGFVVGLVSSYVIAWFYSWRTTPKLWMRENHERHASNDEGHRHYHIDVGLKGASFGFGKRRPAWNSKAIIKVYKDDGSPAIDEDIYGRWASNPEPFIYEIDPGGGQRSFFDPGKYFSGRIATIFPHSPEKLDIVTKFRGETECYIFSNESYQYSYKKPQWRLPEKSYRIVVTVFYEGGPTTQVFRLLNDGTSIDDLRILRT